MTGCQINRPLTTAGRRKCYEVAVRAERGLFVRTRPKGNLSFGPCHKVLDKNSLSVGSQAAEDNERAVGREVGFRIVGTLLAHTCHGSCIQILHEDLGAAETGGSEGHLGACLIKGRRHIDGIVLLQHPFLLEDMVQLVDDRILAIGKSHGNLVVGQEGRSDDNVAGETDSLNSAAAGIPHAKGMRTLINLGEDNKATVRGPGGRHCFAANIRDLPEITACWLGKANLGAELAPLHDKGKGRAEESSVASQGLKQIRTKPVCNFGQIPA